MEASRSVIEIASDEFLVKLLSRFVYSPEGPREPFTVCCFRADPRLSKGKALKVREALQKEKRGDDLLGADRNGNFYLILQCADHEKAEIACSRFTKKIESLLDGLSLSYSMAAFPEDAESPETLMRKVKARPSAWLEPSA